MIGSPKSNGSIRLVLIGVSFVALTLILLVFQPGAPRGSASDTPEASVTRIAPALNGLSDTAVNTPVTGLGTAALAPGDAEPGTMRDMTFDAISNLQTVTSGATPAPGQPGSLLHSVIQRSIGAQPVARDVPEDITATAATPAIPSGKSYFVRPGDTLTAIAQDVFGDEAMAIKIYELNATQLDGHTSLRAGTILELPIQ